LIYKLITSDAEMSELLEDLSKFDLWAVDTETSGLNVRKDIVTDIAFCNGITAYNIVHKVYDNNDFVTYVSHNKCLEALSKLQKLRTHNGSYDTRIIYHYFGINLIEKIYEDSMLAAHTNDENLFNYGLKELGTSVFGASSVDEKKEMLESIKLVGGGDKEYYKADYKVRAKYAMKDVELTWMLCEHYVQLLKAQDLYKFFQEEPMELYRHVTIYMELFGVPVDVKLLQQSLEEINVDITNIENSIHTQIEPFLAPFNKWYLEKEHPFQLSGSSLKTLAELTAPIYWPKTKSGHTFAAKKIEPFKGSDLYKYYSGELRVPEEIKLKVQYALYAASGTKRMFNLLSKHHLKKLFFEILKEIPISKTDKGNPQVDDDTLEAFSTKYAWVKELQTYNKLIKIRGTYIERFLEEQEEGVFYPSFYQHRTDSGRYSGDMQQLPKLYEEEQLLKGEVSALVYKYTNNIRRFFISGTDKIFADFDYDSQEVKVFAHVSGDERIKDIFRKGYDFYSQICIDTEGLTEYSADKKAPNYLGKLNKPARQRAKSYALGLAFNMSPYALSKNLGISESEAKSIHFKYFESFPELKSWVESSKKFAIKNGYIKSEAGRVRRLQYLKENYDLYGDVLFDSLELWKRYNESVSEYARMKQVSKVCRSLLNVSVNFQVQSLAASITNRAAIACAKKLKENKLDARICNVVHDQLTVVTSLHDKDESSRILEECMTNTYKISIELPAPPSWGINFAESKG